MTRPYLTTGRLSEITARLSQNDTDVLATLRRVRVATGLQLQLVHHGLGDAAKQRRIRQLSRLSRWGLVTTLDRRIGGPGGGSVSSVYVLDVGGLRLVAPDARARKPWTPSTPFVAHGLAVTELFVQLARSGAGRFELLDFTTEPTCWRSFIGRGGSTITLKPDAHVVVGVDGDELHWFVEVDLATEAAPRIRAKGAIYLDYLHTGNEQDHVGVFPRVLFVVPDLRRSTQVTAALSAASKTSDGLFVVATADLAKTTLIGDAE